MVNLLTKLILYIKRPRLIIVTGKGRQTAARALFDVLRYYDKVEKTSENPPAVRDIFKNNILIWEKSLETPKDFNNVKGLIFGFLKPILVVTHVGDYHPEREFFAGEISKVEEVKKLISILPKSSQLILNYDDETVREIGDNVQIPVLTFGLGVRANFQASDIIITQSKGEALQKGTNFKINYDGKTVPLWLKRVFGRENVYAVLAS